MIWILLACKPDPETLLDVPPPDFSIEEVESKTQESLALGLPNIPTIQQQYSDSMTLQDENCPDFNGETDGLHGNWLADCQTASGAYFYGFANYFVQEFNDMDGLYASALTASFEIESPDGDAFIAGGTALLELHQFPMIVEMRVNGTFQSLSNARWMEEGSMSLQVFGELMDDQPLEFNGGIQYPLIDVYFNQMTSTPNECDGLPQGTFDIRDSSGYWFSYTSKDCAPCGALQWRGQSYGEICLGEALDQATSQVIDDILDLYP